MFLKTLATYASKNVKETELVEPRPFLNQDTPKRFKSGMFF